MMSRLKIFILLMLLPLTMLAQDDGYRIDSWKYEAQIGADNVWHVTETMRVTFLEPRHGIFRNIPRHFRMGHEANGKMAEYNYYLKIDNLAVLDHNFTEGSNDGDGDQDNLVIKIGNPDKEVEGAQVYIISYDITVPDDRYPASDFIYASVLGTDCNTTIGEFSFYLHFNKALPTNTASALRVFSGKWGSLDNELGVKVEVSKASISGVVKNVDSFNGITLRADVEDGYWEDAHKENSFFYYLTFGFAILLFAITFKYFLFNKREKPLTVIEYSAPEGISSAEVGVIIDNTADLSDLTSLIVWFASKGYLKIKEIEGKKHLLTKDEIDIELIKLKDLPDDAPDYQKKFWKVFFKNRDSVVLSKLGDCHSDISAAQLALQKHFKGKRSLSKTHVKSILSAIAFLFVAIVAFVSSSSAQSIDLDLLFYSVFLWAFPIFIMSVVRIICSNYDMINKLWMRLLQYGIIIVVGLADVWLLQTFFYNEYDSFASIVQLNALASAGWVLTLFSARVNRDSKYRLEKMSLLLGFREFIEKSELPMLKVQVDENPSYFYDVLPYAMVFGLTNKWVKKFKEIDVQNPDWYEGSNPASFSSYMLADHLTHSVSDSISKSIQVSSHDTSVGSSSSHSSGFSGGGVGGGGCGSW